jgi:hypothetical protein
MTDPRTITTRWEYRVIQYVGSVWSSKGEWSQPGQEDWSTEQVLNHLGADGWELVSLGPVHGQGSTPAAAYILKRPAAQNDI